MYIFWSVYVRFGFGAQWEEARKIASFYTIAAALSFFTTPFERSNVIVNAWWYGPAWHFSRLVTTILVVGLSWFLRFTFWEFLYLLILQVSVMHIIDGMASFLFASSDSAERYRI